MEKSNFFALVSRMKYINRWGLMRNAISENIQEHSLQVAIIAHALVLIKNKYFNGKLAPERAALYGIYHDTNEIITGDLPTPVKYNNNNLTDAYKSVEEKSKKKLISMLPEDFQKDYEEIFFYEEDEEYKDVVKAADKISAYFKCVEELKTGNSEFKQAGESLKQKIDEFGPEVKYFMEVFGEGFNLSLDQLQ